MAQIFRKGNYTTNAIHYLMCLKIVEFVQKQLKLNWTDSITRHTFCSLLEITLESSLIYLEIQKCHGRFSVFCVFYVVSRHSSSHLLLVKCGDSPSCYLLAVPHTWRGKEIGFFMLLHKKFIDLHTKKFFFLKALKRWYLIWLQLTSYKCTW